MESSSSPCSLTEPESTRPPCSIRIIARPSVLLPHALSPAIPIDSPSSSEKLTSSTAWTSPLDVGYLTTRLLTSSTMRWCAAAALSFGGGGVGLGAPSVSLRQSGCPEGPGRGRSSGVLRRQMRLRGRSRVARQVLHGLQTRDAAAPSPASVPPLPSRAQMQAVQGRTDRILRPAAS